MSKVDWKALGEQEQAKLDEASKRAELDAEKMRKVEATRAEVAESLSLMLKGKLAEISSALKSAAGTYNSGVASQDLKLNFIDQSNGSKSVSLHRGLLSLVFKQEEKTIKKAIQRGHQDIKGTELTYGVSDQGELTIRNGAGLIEVETVVDSALQDFLRQKDQVQFGPIVGR